MGKHPEKKPARSRSATATRKARGDRDVVEDALATWEAIGVVWETLLRVSRGPDAEGGQDAPAELVKFQSQLARVVRGSVGMGALRKLLKPYTDALAVYNLVTLETVFREVKKVGDVDTYARQQTGYLRGTAPLLGVDRKGMEDLLRNEEVAKALHAEGPRQAAAVALGLLARTSSRTVWRTMGRFRARVRARSRS